jgi:hypothetical protein
MAGLFERLHEQLGGGSWLIPRVTFFSLPGLSHCEAYARSELVLPRVTGFLKAVNIS